MSIYFLVLDPVVLHRQLAPPLAAAWRQRSFVPCRSLGQELLPVAQSYAQQYHLPLTDLLIPRVAVDLSFDRSIWRALVGEVLLIAAVEIPEIPTAPDVLRCLLAPERCGTERGPREQFAPIEQVLFGTRDLVFGGGFYRTDHAGCNDVADVVRLAAYLASVDPQRWSASDLERLPDLDAAADCADELEYARQGFAALCDLYRRTSAAGRLIVCEEM